MRRLLVPEPGVCRAAPREGAPGTPTGVPLTQVCRAARRLRVGQGAGQVPSDSETVVHQGCGRMKCLDLIHALFLITSGGDATPVVPHALRPSIMDDGASWSCRVSRLMALTLPYPSSGCRWRRRCGASAAWTPPPRCGRWSPARIPGAIVIRCSPYTRPTANMCKVFHAEELLDGIVLCVRGNLACAPDHRINFNAYRPLSECTALPCPSVTILRIAHMLCNGFHCPLGCMTHPIGCRL